MLKVQSIDAFYGDSHILHQICLTVPLSARVSVLGRNGAGKSTLMKSVLNAGPRVEGTILLNEESLVGRPSYQIARMGLALVPEDRRIFPHLSVVDNIEISRAALADREPISLERVMTNFPMLQQLSTRFGSQLSGGQQQMLAVARGITSRPNLLLLDEPTEGLAPVIVKQLAQSVTSLCDEYGIGLLLSEQNIWFARKCTDKVYIIDSGRIVFEGTWEIFDQNEQIKNRYLSV